MSRYVSLALSIAALAPLNVASAQLVITPPNFQVTPLASAISATGESMAVDLLGNVYVTSSGPGFGGLSSIVQIAPDGTVTPSHATGFDVLGQLATNPLDGFVYLLSRSGTLPAQLSSVSRIEPTGDSTPLFVVDLFADGFTIANDGTLYFGGSGSSGTGIYAAPFVPGGGVLSATFVDPGVGANDHLLSLVSGDVLIATGDRVERLVPGVPGTLPYFDATPGPFIVPNEIQFVSGLARNPFNQLGAGALISVHDFVTVCFCGSGLAYFADPDGDLTPPGPVSFAREDFTLFPGSGSGGLPVVAAGLRHDLYWLMIDGGSPGALTFSLSRIEEVPAAGVQGSHFASAGPGFASFAVQGPVASGDPFLLGAALAPTDALATFVPGWGLVELYPFAGGYVPLLDGVGLFGPPAPLAVTPPGGLASVAFPVPPGLSGLSFGSQALILSADAPNGGFFATNVAAFTIP